MSLVQNQEKAFRQQKKDSLRGMKLNANKTQTDKTRLCIEN